MDRPASTDSPSATCTKGQYARTRSGGILYAAAVNYPSLAGALSMPIPPKVVAVVEDDHDMRKGIERLLQAHGFAIQAFTSAEAFLAAERRNETTCLVLDIHLGGISGIELRRRLAVSDPYLPIIFITAVVDEHTRRQAAEAGCIAYLQKPFAANLLIAAIDKATAEAKTRGEGA